MPIFNSLGSNYSFFDALIALRELVWPNQLAKKKLATRLSEVFAGEAVLLFNGRDAIEYCLKAYGLGKGDQVLTQALSCSSLEEAIRRTGAEPCYFDLEKDKLHTTLTQVKQAFSRAKKPPKALILQHTLGYTDQVQEIAKFCHQNKILLIEDLAQAMGAQDHRGKLLGSQADAIILSFGRDKVLDAISGGAVIFRHSSSAKPNLPELEDWFELKHDKQNKTLVLKLLLYPLFSILIRSTYSLQLGKGLHWLLRKTKMMEQQIVSPHDHFQSFPAYFAPLVLRRLSSLEQQLAHRRQIAEIYLDELSDCSQLSTPVTKVEIAQGTNLRFPVVVSESRLPSLLAFLTEQNYHLSDRWYRKPVDSGSFNYDTVYQAKSCPNAESLANQVLNLPTHRQTNQKKAKQLAQLIKKWYSNQ